MIDNENNSDADVQSFMHAVYTTYGYDFYNYSSASFKRRLTKAVSKYNAHDIRGLSDRVLHDRDFFSQLLNDLTITVTEMFRDPPVYKKLREQVIPYLKTYPEIKIWSAGCAGGEEAFSLAILLMEEGLYDRCMIYATDINLAALKQAKEGIVPLWTIKEGSGNYFAAGGKHSLSDYYMAKYDAAIFSNKVRERIIFADHNLVTDKAFGEMQLILCRNVMIYFERKLQDQVLCLFSDSLCRGGFLCIGTKECMNAAPCKKDFDEFLNTERIYRKRS